MKECANTSIAVSASHEPRRNRFLMLGLAFVLVIASGCLFFSHNDFSYRCHPDEPGKVRQIAEHTRNYHHPLLMLNATQAVVDFSSMQPSPQNIARTGRSVTAVFSIIGILGFVAAAYVTAGPLAALLCGLFLLEAPLVVEVAHYFKEDPAMMMGLGLVFLAMALYRKRPGFGALGLMAVGAALAGAGKHVGLAILPFCFYEIYKQKGGWKQVAGFTGIVAVVYAVVNYQMISHFWGYLGGVDREIAVIQEQGTIKAKGSIFYPLAKYRSTFIENVPPPVLWFALFGVWASFRQKARTVGPAALYAFLFFVVISATPKTAARYALPVIWVGCYVGAVGAAWVWQKQGRAWKWAGFALPLALAVGISVPRTHAVYSALAKDSRRTMAQWITQHLPADQVIAQDHYGLLENTPENPYHVNQPLFYAGYEIRGASEATLRANGVRYVVATSRNLGGKGTAAAKVAVAAADPVGQRLAHWEKVWEYPKRTPVANVSPQLTIYRLPAE